MNGIHTNKIVTNGQYGKQLSTTKFEILAMLGFTKHVPNYYFKSKTEYYVLIRRLYSEGRSKYTNSCSIGFCRKKLKFVIITKNKLIKIVLWCKYLLHCKSFNHRLLLLKIIIHMLSHEQKTF